MSCAIYVRVVAFINCFYRPNMLIDSSEACDFIGVIFVINPKGLAQGVRALVSVASPWA
jgi:hypothetical protein